MSKDKTGKASAKAGEDKKPWQEPHLKQTMTDDEAKDAVGGGRNWPPGTNGGRSPSYDVTGRVRPYLQRTGQMDRW